MVNPTCQRTTGMDTHTGQTCALEAFKPCHSGKIVLKKQTQASFLPELCASRALSTTESLTPRSMTDVSTSSLVTL